MLNNKAQQVETAYTAPTDEELSGVFKFGGREIELPLEKGKQWTTTFTVEGETFTSEVTQEFKVENIEKVKVPAGEFDAFNISVSGRSKGRDNRGNATSGRDQITYWVAFVHGVPVWVKIEYRKASGERVSRELVSTTFK